MRYSAILLIIAALLLVPFQAQKVSAQAFVAGCANGGPLATPGTVSAAAKSAATSVSNEVTQAGRSIKMEQKKIVAAINKNFEVQNSLIRQIVTSLGVSMEKMDNMRMFGPQSKAYGIGTVSGRLNTVMSGKAAEGKMSGHYRNSLNEHTKRFKTPYQRSLFYKKEKIESITPAFFFPQNSVLSIEQSRKADFAVKSVVDPFPTPKLPEKFKARGKMMGYEAERKVKYSRLAMPAAIISDVVASYQPTMELGEWAEKMYHKMGGSGQPPQVVDGKISPMGYIDLMVNARFANQQWYSGFTGIHSMTPTGILRELAVMESVNMEMQRRQMKYMQQTTALLAQDQAAKAGEEFNNSLTQTYQKVVQER